MNAEKLLLDFSLRLIRKFSVHDKKLENAGRVPTLQFEHAKYWFEANGSESASDRETCAYSALCLLSMLFVQAS